MSLLHNDLYFELEGDSTFTRTALIFTLLVITSCSTTNRPTLGETVTLTPGWFQLKRTSIQAFHDPNVWAPLLTGVLLQIDNLDHEISDQLSEETPLFGNTNDAREAADDFRDLTEAAYITTALLVPGPEAIKEWLGTKAKLVGSEWLAVEAARGFVSGVKEVARRERPNERNHKSFPSSHTVSSSTRAQMAKLNVDYLPIGSASSENLKLTFDGIAALTAWARVEAGEHYPSDVLTSWGVGYFFSFLARDFIVPDRQQVLIRPHLTSDGNGFGLIIKF